MMGGPAGSWAHGLAGVTAGATLLLIVAGGLVTNTGAALAVPDWPTTFGQNMFLYPWSEMVGGVLWEHSHRLLGALVGCLTLALGVTLWVSERRRSVRRLAAAAVLLVCFQGLLGGLRVVLLRDTLAIVHGCLAQVFFALTTVLTLVTSPGWTAAGEVSRPPSGPRPTRGLAWLALVMTVATYGQIVLGALATHAGQILAHLGGAVVVGVAALILTVWVLARHATEATLAWPARAIGFLLLVQIGLGLGAYAARFTGLALPGGEVAVIGLPVAHRAIGALFFAAATVLTLNMWRLRPADAPGARALIGAGIARSRVPV